MRRFFLSGLILFSLPLSAQVVNEVHKLNSFDALTLDQFGHSVSVRGDLAVVGAPGADQNPQIIETGAAYALRFNGTDWVDDGKLVAADAELWDLFGFSPPAPKKAIWLEV